MRYPLRFLVANLLLLLAADHLSAQADFCETGRIVSVRLHGDRVFNDSAGAVLGRLYELGNWLHVETREDVLRRELLFREGDCHDAFRLSESERLLRQFDFLQSASVTARRRADGDVDVTVATHDDWSLRLEPRLDFAGGPEFTGIGLAERNIAGTGRGADLLFVDRPGRDEVALAFSDPQLLNSRWNLGLTAARTAPGWLVRESVAFPFVGLVGRWAAFEDALYGELWFRYVAGDSERRSELILPYTRKAAQLGGAFRLRGTPTSGRSRQATYGFSVSFERLSYEDGFSEDSIDMLRPEAVALISGDLAALGLQERRTVRLNLLVGVSALRFVQRTAINTLTAEEDVALGGDVDFTLGLASEAFGSGDSHLLGAVEAYGGARVIDGWFSLLSANLEGRHDNNDVGRWRDVFGAARWTNYWLVAPGHTVALTASWSAGWETTVPFQLTLGGPWGLAGYAAHRFPGGSRAVVRLEDRRSLATFGRLFDLGTLALIDVGRIWSNGAPYGVDSGVRSSVGAGIRIATPAGTRLAYRLQLAVPLEAGLSMSDVVISLRVDRFLRLDGENPDHQLARSRDVGLRSATRHTR